LLLEIWRRSVAATHDFLSSDDFRSIDRVVAEEYLPSAALTVATDAADAPVAFLGGSGCEID